MDSKVNTYSSATNCANEFNQILADGYSLKKTRLKQWIYANNQTQPSVARVLELSADEFKRKLREHEKFDRAQMKKLINLLGAENAFNVIYFPSKKFRKEVWWQVFGKTRFVGDDNE